MSSPSPKGVLTLTKWVDFVILCCEKGDFGLAVFFANFPVHNDFGL